jgi:metallophosphoesterase (TIGR00282 family)
MLGDVVGESGLTALETLLPVIRDEADLIVVNGENAADGFGITGQSLQRILGAGADVVTTGNHVWEKREFWSILEKDERVLRPANYPEGCIGRGWVQIEKAGVSWLVINLQGRDMLFPIDCPFRTFDRIAASAGSGLIAVDFHAESTREKESLGYYLDGRASLVAGTHTHILTADERILPRGTGYITDIGMTGAKKSIIGMDIAVCADRVKTQVTYRMPCAQGPGMVQGVCAEIDSATKKTLFIARIEIS